MAPHAAPTGRQRKRGERLSLEAAVLSRVMTIHRQVHERLARQRGRLWLTAQEECLMPVEELLAAAEHAGVTIAPSAFYEATKAARQDREERRRR